MHSQVEIATRGPSIYPWVGSLIGCLCISAKPVEKYLGVVHKRRRRRIASSFNQWGKSLHKSGQLWHAKPSPSLPTTTTTPQHPSIVLVPGGCRFIHHSTWPLPFFPIDHQLIHCRRRQAWRSREPSYGLGTSPHTECSSY